MGEGFCKKIEIGHKISERESERKRELENEREQEWRNKRKRKSDRKRKSEQERESDRKRESKQEREKNESGRACKKKTGAREKNDRKTFKNPGQRRVPCWYISLNFFFSFM